jgi:hypothetical protein
MIAVLAVAPRRSLRWIGTVIELRLSPRRWSDPWEQRWFSTTAARAIAIASRIRIHHKNACRLRTLIIRRPYVDPQRHARDIISQALSLFCV